MIQDYGFRLYNPAIGKFLSVDPLSPNYPMLTPYQFASNTPIVAIDLDGLEQFKVTAAPEPTHPKIKRLIITPVRSSKRKISRDNPAVGKDGVEYLSNGKAHVFPINENATSLLWHHA